MFGELAIRFLVGGIVVSLFAVIGDIVQPKSFAGIFGAAPSVALATLGLTLAKHGGDYTAVEGQSMLAGAVALFVYCLCVSWLFKRRKWNTLKAATYSFLLWFIVAFGLQAIF